MIVVDTNVIGYLYLSAERSVEAELAFQKDSEWVSPFLWRSEFRNVLAGYLHRDLVSVEDATRIMREAESLMEGREYTVESGVVLRLAQSSGCSAYDCEFVALAQDLNVPLVTVDRKIVAEFPNTAIILDKFVVD